jgi:hypothetical protein
VVVVDGKKLQVGEEILGELVLPGEVAWPWGWELVVEGGSE